MSAWDDPVKSPSRLNWRAPEYVPEEPLPKGTRYSNVPKGVVRCPVSGRASSRVYRWPTGRGWTVALGVVGGPHPESRYYAGSLQAAVGIAEALVTESPLPSITPEEIAGDGEADGTLEDLLKASLKAHGRSR